LRASGLCINGEVKDVFKKTIFKKEYDKILLKIFKGYD
jgi:hypothetical protein